MAKYRILAKSVKLVEVCVEAANKEEAKEMYEGIGYDDFHQYDGYFELDEIEQIDDDDDVEIDFTYNEVMYPEY